MGASRKLTKNIKPSTGGGGKKKMAKFEVQLMHLKYLLVDLRSLGPDNVK